MKLKGYALGFALVSLINFAHANTYFTLNNNLSTPVTLHVSEYCVSNATPPFADGGSINITFKKTFQYNWASRRYCPGVNGWLKVSLEYKGGKTLSIFNDYESSSYKYENIGTSETLWSYDKSKSIHFVLSKATGDNNYTVTVNPI
ncbi:hypothetical protein [Facilibium subflavum]|uniref:hypothetical protein n=1 Tax=Facilibium subflavum TaxID=2219058 RepID=UPI000E64CD11|nr:hypothetical protein [Facilibium subflavum]